MTQRSKVVENFRAAVQDIPDGATIAFGGFAMPGVPFNLIRALHDHGAKQLTLVANTTGGAQQPRMPDIGMLVENGQVKKVICAFTAATRPTDVLPFTKYYESGEVDAELVPQGTLAERLRAGGAGIPAFYTPAGVGTLVADGGLPWRHGPDGSVVVASPPKEVRVFDEREYVLERGIVTDFALVRAARGDRHGNLSYDASARNFNPLCAMSGRITIAEVEQLVEPGELDPEHIDTPGVFVQRVVQVGEEGKRIEKRTLRPRPEVAT